MLRHTHILSRLSLGALGVLGLVVLLALSDPSAGQQPARDQQAAELEKQIEALKKKLDELRRGNGIVAATVVGPEVEGTLNPAWVKSLTWRSIGPAAMGGRITAISVYEADPSTYWVATASGGLLKTVNNGVTFEHQFDRESTVSLGDVCVAPSDRNIVWVGTGENNPRNSVSYGDGVYKSTDGGKTWKNMGLRQSFQTGRIIVHPKNPNIVYVGALGRLYGPNVERGLFKTTNGGETWDKVLHVDDKTGVIDMQMHPTDPETLLVATWERQRDGFDSHRGEPPPAEGYDAYDPIKKWGPGSGLFKTTDGGKTFRKLTTGLPTCALGRMGIDYYRKDPRTVFLIVDCEKIGMGTAPRTTAGGAYLGVQGADADAGARLTQVVAGGPADKAGLQADDIILAVDNKTLPSYNQLLEVLQGQKAGNKVTLKVSRNRESREVAVTLEERPAGGPGQRFGSGSGVQSATRTRPNGFAYGGQRENVQDQQGPDSFQYGGVYKSTDGGESWTRLNSLNPRPMYFSQIRVDPSDDQYLYVLGISLHRSSDGGKTFRADGNRRVHPDQHALWINPRDGRHMIVGCDGGFYVTYDRMTHWDHLNHLAIGQFYHVAVDNRRPYHIYGGLQDNGSWGGPSQSLRGTGTINEDWIVVGSGDGFVCRVDPNDPDLVYYESQDGNMGRRNLRTGEVTRIRPRDVQGQPPYRFNWNTPFILSQHNSHIFYCGGNYVFRSVKRGDDLRVVSPEITRTKRGTATALAESPRNPDVLWVGTDDGALWVTRDGGAKWTNVADKVGLPGPRWVATIEPSRFVEGRTYVTFDAHRSDDDEPYVYVTEDFGQTWKSLRANLPGGPTRVLREDIQNQNLLFAGTELAAWVSLNRGASWTKLNNNLPTVAIHELAIHPTAGEMVAATHGRSLWVLDIKPLRQMTADVLKARATLFEPNPGVRWRTEPPRGSPYGSGARRFFGENPPRGTPIYYALGQKADKVSLKIVDFEGKTVRELQARTEPGLHRLTWDLTRPAPRPGGPGGRFRGTGQGGGPRGGGQAGQPRAPAQAPAGEAAAAGQRGFRPGFQFGQPVTPGMYRVVLTVDGKELTQHVRVELDPALPGALLAEQDTDVEEDK
ncbi:MAG: PDZ domain-containing protein [Gemmataceae bacterium]|nr:PDZ domain-containing protein [Gemmataceae bacterium]